MLEITLADKRKYTSTDDRARRVLGLLDKKYWIEHASIGYYVFEYIGIGEPQKWWRLQKGSAEKKLARLVGNQIVSERYVVKIDET